MYRQQLYYAIDIYLYSSTKNFIAWKASVLSEIYNIMYLYIYLHLSKVLDRRRTWSPMHSYVLFEGTISRIVPRVLRYNECWKRLWFFQDGVQEKQKFRISKYLSIKYYYKKLRVIPGIFPVSYISFSGQVRTIFWY